MPLDPIPKGRGLRGIPAQKRGIVRQMIKILPELEAIQTFEAYPSAPEIDGVWVLPLRKNRSENGWFMEYMRVTGGNVDNIPSPLEVRQISVSYADPERINAFHIHTKLEQNEIWTVIAGQLVVWLVDCRAGSRTAGVKRKLVLSGEQPMQVYIPAGVAHGYQAGRDGATLLYCMNQQFNLSDPNEGRLPWNQFGADLWEANRG
jgi:dTDP-4-dehydrorhamnose 3,5-epimerase